ncbi:MAG: DUF4190 domain-containing protein [Chloroflexota bacterium]
MNEPYSTLPPAGPRTSTTALISLIGGIAGWTVLPFLGSIVAIITGHMAKSEIKKSAGTVAGNGLATAGLILGYVSIAFGVCLICVFVLLPILGIGLSIPFMNNITTY